MTLATTENGCDPARQGVPVSMAFIRTPDRYHSSPHQGSVVPHLCVRRGLRVGSGSSDFGRGLQQTAWLNGASNVLRRTSFDVETSFNHFHCWIARIRLRADSPAAHATYYQLILTGES